MQKILIKDCRLTHKVLSLDLCTWANYLSTVIIENYTYIEDITRWREDMNFIFEWQNNILRTSAASE